MKSWSQEEIRLIFNVKWKDKQVNKNSMVGKVSLIKEYFFKRILLKRNYKLQIFNLVNHHVFTILYLYDIL